MKKIVDLIIRVAASLGIALGYFSGALVGLMMVLVGVEVVMRYAFNNSPMIADEFSGYLLVAMSFLGISYTFLKHGHVRITFLADRLPEKVAAWSRLAILLVELWFVAVMCWASLEYLQFSSLINERSSTWVHFPLKYPQATVLIGFCVLLAVLVGEVVRVGRVALFGGPGSFRDAKDADSASTHL